MDDGANDLSTEAENDLNLKLNESTHELNNEDSSLTNGNTSFETMPVFQECQINCLQDMESINCICKDLKLKLREPTLQLEDDDDSSIVDGEYEVEEIVDYARDKCEDWYLVKWKGWESEFNTWEPLSNLTQCQLLIDEYHEKCRNESLSGKRKLSVNEQIRRGKLEKIYRFFTEQCDSTTNDMATLFKLKGINPEEFNYSGSSVKKLKRDLRDMFASSLYNGRKTTGKKLEAWCDAELMDFAEKRKEVLRKLKAWENEINDVSGEVCPIIVENDVDLEGPPKNFIYITDYKAGEGISIPEDPLVGCDCTNCYENQKNCCSMQSSGSFAYNRFGYLKVQKGTPIYECNKRCQCGFDCLNRVVQKGRQIKLSIFRTHNGRGWGVKALEKIKKGIFVMEYVGEVITSEEAERRGQIYDAEGRTYLFDLDYNDGDCPFTVDAAFYGNIAHFMNHSCDPNLVVYAVWINNLDPRLPRIAFFSQRDIRKGEELTFDYLMTSTTTNAVPSSPSKMSVPESSTITKDLAESPSTSTPPHSPTETSSSLPLPVSEEPSESSSVSNTLSFHSPSKLSVGTEQTRKRIVCKCGAENCRGYVF